MKKINIKNIFPLLTIFLLSCSKKEDSPNFVFLLVDDLGWADVKCNFPETFYETPNIDRMAQHGVRFINAYSANPVSSPSRSALLTGRHPNRTGITDWIPGDDPHDRKLVGPKDNHELALDEVTIAEKLKEKDYKTCFVGKWHLGGEGHLPENQGFDINHGGYEAGQPPAGYFSPYKNPKLKDGPVGEYLTDRLADESIKFINENKEVPFFLYLAFYTVHTPIQPSKEFIDVFEKKRNELGIDSIPYRKEGEGLTKLVQEDAAFASMVASMDKNVGRILDELNKLGLDKNTWVIFTSDNGGLSTIINGAAPGSNGPLRAGKGFCYEGGIRVPLVITGPAIKTPGRTENQPVVGMDFFPTILSIAGIEHQENDGKNLLPILIDQKKINRDILFWHFPHYHGSGWVPGSALRKGDWKIVNYYEDDRTELFNLADDPGETNNLSDMNPDLAAEMKDLLMKKLTESEAKFPELNPDYKDSNQ